MRPGGRSSTEILCHQLIEVISNRQKQQRIMAAASCDDFLAALHTKA